MQSLPFEINEIWSRVKTCMEQESLKNELLSAGYSGQMHKSFADMIEEGFLTSPERLHSILIPIAKFYVKRYEGELEHIEKLDHDKKSLQNRIVPLFKNKASALDNVLNEQGKAVADHNDLRHECEEALRIIDFALHNPRLKQIDPAFSRGMHY